MVLELKNNCDNPVCLFLFDDIQHRSNIISPKLVQTILMIVDNVFGDIEDAEIQKGTSEIKSDMPCDISTVPLEPYEDQISQESQDSSQDCACNSQTRKSKMAKIETLSLLFRQTGALMNKPQELDKTLLPYKFHNK